MGVRIASAGEYAVTLAATARSTTVSGKGIPRTPVLRGPLWVIGSTVRLHAIIDKGIIEVILGLGRIVALHPPRIHFISDLVGNLVPIFMKRECDGTLGYLQQPHRVRNEHQSEKDT